MDKVQMHTISVDLDENKNSKEDKLLSQEGKPDKQLTISNESCQILTKKQKDYLQKEQFLNFIMCNMDCYFKHKLYQKMTEKCLNVHSIISENDQDRKKFSQIFNQMKNEDVYQVQRLGLNNQESRGIAAILGMAIGDALGASTQFLHFKKEGLGIIKQGFNDIHCGIINGTLQMRHKKVGVWTDDASMGLCIADSILLNGYQFNPKHIRYMFNLWLNHGLNNGGRPYSIGLGGNISISMEQFETKQQDYTFEGDRFNSGNGSLMRLAPIPVAYSDKIQKGVQFSGLQSLTTHNGLEAKECCRLMANILIQLINRKQDIDGKKLIFEVCDKFVSEIKSVQYLAKGMQQSEQVYLDACKKFKKFKKFNKTILDRNWNWRDPSHSYSPCRFKQQPGYIGSYCMDALSMALHTVIFTNSFKQVVTMNADMGGDCDTVGSIAGQIAGALYGVNDQMLKLYSQMQDFTESRYDVFLKSYKLATKKRLN